MESSTVWEESQCPPLMQWSSSSFSSMEDLQVDTRKAQVVPHMMMSPVYHTMALEDDEDDNRMGMDNSDDEDPIGLSHENLNPNERMISNRRPASPMDNYSTRSAMLHMDSRRMKDMSNSGTSRRQMMGEPEDLELMTVTVLDGDLDSNVEQAFVKVSENVHILRQSSLQASRLTKEINQPLDADTGNDSSTNLNSKVATNSMTFPKTKHDMTKSLAQTVPKFDLSPRSVISLDIPLHNYTIDSFHHRTPSATNPFRSTSSVKSTTSSTATPTPSTKHQFYGGKSAHSSIEFRPSSRNTVNFQLATSHKNKHKRVHSTGNQVFRSMESKSVSALRPSRYLASPHPSATLSSSNHTNATASTSSYHREIRHSKSWSPLPVGEESMIPSSDNSISKQTTLSAPLPSSFLTTSSSSSSSSLSISRQLYPNPNHSQPKSIPSNKTTTTISSNTKNSNSSVSSKISLQSTLSSHSSHDRPIPPSSSSKAMSLATIHDTSPYNSPNPKSKKQYSSSKSSPSSSSTRKTRMTPLEQTLSQLKSSDSISSSKHKRHPSSSSTHSKKQVVATPSSSSHSKKQVVATSSSSTQSKDTASFVKINMKREEGVEIHCQCSVM